MVINDKLLNCDPLDAQNKINLEFQSYCEEPLQPKIIIFPVIVNTLINPG